MSKYCILLLIIFYLGTNLYGIVGEPFGEPPSRTHGTSLIFNAVIGPMKQNAATGPEGDWVVAVIDDVIVMKDHLAQFNQYSGRHVLVQSITDGQEIFFYLWRQSEQTVWAASRTLASNNSHGVIIGSFDMPYEVWFDTLLGHTVHGRVTLADHTPLPSIEVGFSEAVPPYRSFLFRTPFRTNVNGFYAIPGIAQNTVISGLTPISEIFMFTPPPVTLPPIVGNVQVNFIAAPIPDYRIFGHVKHGEIPLQDVEITAKIIFNNVEVEISEHTDIDGYYEFLVRHGRDVTLSASLNGWTFYPLEVNIPFLDKEEIVDFASEPILHKITGKVSNLDNITGLTLGLAPEINHVINTDGSFEITDLRWGSYLTITPEKFGYTFSPDSLHFSFIVDDYEDANFYAILNQYNITGEVLLGNLPFDDAVMHYNINDGEVTTIPIASGSFTFSVYHGDSVRFYPVKDGYRFTPRFRTLNNITNHVSDQNFTAELIPHYDVTFRVFTEADVGVTGVSIRYSIGVGAETTFPPASMIEPGVYQKAILEEEENIVFTLFSVRYDLSPDNVFFEGLFSDRIVDILATEKTFSITGNTGIGGATIFVNGVPVKTSDANGDFILTGIPYGSVLKIEPKLHGYTFEPEYLEREIPRDLELENIFSYTPNPINISGFVYYENKIDDEYVPVQGVRIFALNDENRARDVHTDVDGAFTFVARFNETNLSLSANKPWYIFTPTNVLITRVIEERDDIVFYARVRVADVVFTVTPPGTTFEPYKVHILDSPVSITLSTETVEADIYFTLDVETDPDINSTKYTGEPFVLDIGDVLRIRSRAFKVIYDPSVITYATFAATTTLNKPIFSIDSGEFDHAIRVGITAEHGASIFYTLDGSIPTIETGKVYRDTLLFVNKNTRLRAIAWREYFEPSEENVAVYLFNHNMVFHLPETLYLSRNTWRQEDLGLYLTDSVEGPHEYKISIVDNTIYIEMTVEDNTLVWFNPKTDWFGTEHITFRIETTPVQLEGVSERIPDFAIDTVLFNVAQDVFPPFILNYSPRERDISVVVNSNLTFFVNIVHTGDIGFSWELNGVNLHRTANYFNHTFMETGVNTVRVLVSRTTERWENIWTIDVGEVSDSSGEQAIRFENRIIGNYPNPFNPQTTISFSLADETQVNISIFNARGQLIEQLADRVFSSGINNIVWDASEYSSGIYYIFMQSETFHDVRKILLVK